ncbi:DUF4174 domain-containing protein [Galbibacter sp. BG1]|uniref:DUF4174 domain-containing protein n=1 Tax=Galbibacter sp. BG1 TaxID=1170699 RepID=UPI0015BD6763|nr:DUF4174 domain-containing protein [Galbibacter sp. BG1]QLE01704.1 DUF4174 domain-containing protein [Galbibacter sp. BG1]
MKNTIVIFLMLVVVGFHAKSQNMDLTDLKWKNRIVVVKYNNPIEVKNAEQTQLFLKNDQENKDRDLLIFSIDPEKAYMGEQKTSQKPEQFWEQLHLKQDFEGVILIGKDGGIKLKKEFLVQPEEVYALIDTMPMRKREMDNN